jgi:uncharacterized membrane protein YebE (DUF533 family)
MSDGVTRLRLSMEDGSIQMGSGEVTSKRAQEGTSSFGAYTAEELQGVTPYNSYEDFVKDTQSEAYKGNWQNPREAEAYREHAAKRLARTEQIATMANHLSGPTNTAEAIVAADASIPLSIAQKATPFATREERAKAYTSPLYAQSADHRAETAARDALTTDF